MKFKQAFILFILSIASYTLFAQQSTDAIINDYFNAIGGRDKIGQINSVYTEGSFEIMNNTGESKATILNGKGFKAVTNFSGQDIVQVVTDTSGWMINPFMGSPEPAPMPKEKYITVKDNIYVAGTLFNYKTTGDNVQFTGMDNVEGKPAYKIETISKDSVKTTYYIDSATHYLTQLVREYSGQSTTAKYSDFKKTDFGNTMPYKEELTLPQGFQATSTITKVEINKPVDPSIFNMPAKQ